MSEKLSLPNIIEIKDDSYQVFLFACPAHIPFSLGLHPWFVVNKKGKLSRYEVRYTRNSARPELGYIHIDELPLLEGIGMFHFLTSPQWNARLLGSLQGGEDSSAHKMSEYIESSPQTYPHKNKYCMFGPNSNTYAQWILHDFPEFDGTLPWNAFGRNYKKGQ
jgi:hypothetical protein